MSRYFELHATRNFGRKLNAVIEFIRYNARPFGKSMLYITGPFILIGSVLITHFMNFIIFRTAANPEDMFDGLQSTTSVLSVFLAFIFLFLGSIALISTVYEYLKLYEKKKSNDITVMEVWDKVKSNMWALIGTILVFIVAIVAVMVVYFIFAAILALIHPVIIIFSIILLFIGLFFVMAYFMLTICIQVYENIGLSQAFKRASFLIRENWWSTLGIIFITSMIQGTISYAFMMPVYAVNLVNMLHSGGEFGEIQDPSLLYQILNYVCYGLYTMANYLLYSIPLLAVAFQYFNLREKKEASGLLNRLETFGQTDSTETDEEHY